MSHDPTGRLTALAAEWTLDSDPTTSSGDGGQPTTGLLRWQSTVAWSAVGGLSHVSRVYAEPGIDATQRLTLANGGDRPIDSLPVEVTGQRSSDWSVDPGSTCVTALPLAPQQTCDLDLRLHTDTPGSSSPVVVVHWPGWDQVVDPALDTTVVGPPRRPWSRRSGPCSAWAELARPARRGPHRDPAQRRRRDHVEHGRRDEQR